MRVTPFDSSDIFKNCSLLDFMQKCNVNFSEDKIEILFSENERILEHIKQKQQVAKEIQINEKQLDKLDKKISGTSKKILSEREKLDKVFSSDKEKIKLRQKIVDEIREIHSPDDNCNFFVYRLENRLYIFKDKQITDEMKNDFVKNNTTKPNTWHNYHQYPWLNLLESNVNSFRGIAYSRKMEIVLQKIANDANTDGNHQGNIRVVLNEPQNVVNCFNDDYIKNQEFSNLKNFQFFEYFCNPDYGKRNSINRFLTKIWNATGKRVYVTTNYVYSERDEYRYIKGFGTSYNYYYEEEGRYCAEYQSVLDLFSKKSILEWEYKKMKEKREALFSTFNEFNVCQ